MDGVRRSSSREQTVKEVVIKILGSRLDVSGTRATRRCLIVGVNSCSRFEFIEFSLLQIESMKAIKDCNWSSQASHHKPRNEWWHFVKTSWLK